MAHTKNTYTKRHNGVDLEITQEVLTRENAVTYVQTTVRGAHAMVLQVYTGYSTLTDQWRTSNAGELVLVPDNWPTITNNGTTVSLSTAHSNHQQWVQYAMDQVATYVKGRG